MDRQDIHNTIVSELSTIFPKLDTATITEEDSLHDLGANSIDRCDIITNVLHQHRVDVNLTSFIHCKNIGDIITVIINANKQS